jgi:hypothetical protein
LHCSEYEDTCNRAFKTCILCDFKVYTRPRPPPRTHTHTHTHISQNTSMNVVLRCRAAFPRLVYLTNAPIIVNFTMSRVDGCHTVSMTGLYCNNLYPGTLAKYLPHHCFRGPTTRVLGHSTYPNNADCPHKVTICIVKVVGRQQISNWCKQTLAISLTIVIFIDCRWKTDKWYFYKYTAPTTWQASTCDKYLPYVPVVGTGFTELPSKLYQWH